MSQTIDVETLVRNEIDTRISFRTQYGKTTTAELIHEIRQQRLDSDILTLYHEELDRRLVFEIELNQLREAERMNKEERDELNSSITEAHVSDESSYADVSSSEESDSESGDEYQSSKPGFNDILSAFGEVSKDTLTTRVEEWRSQVAREQPLNIKKLEQDIRHQIAHIQQLKKQREEREAKVTERDYDGDVSSSDNDDDTLSSSSSSSSSSSVDDHEETGMGTPLLSLRGDIYDVLRNVLASLASSERRQNNLMMV